MKKITTVLGDICPDELGFTSIHEHTSVTLRPCFPIDFFNRAEKNKENKFMIEDISALKEGDDWLNFYDNIYYDCLEEETEEMKIFKASGGGAIVDGSAEGIRVNINTTKEASKRSGVHVIACSGLYCGFSFPKFINPYKLATIRQFVLKEINEGINNTDIKAGCIKSAFSPINPAIGYHSEEERAVFRALCQVAAETGYPLELHYTQREHIQEVLDIAIKECGMNPEKIDVCHQDTVIAYKNAFPDYREFMRNPNKVVESYVEHAKAILDRGVSINFDTWGQFHIANTFDNGNNSTYSIDDNRRLSVMIPLLEQGYASQIMLGHDKTGSIFNYRKGGYGYTRVLNYAVPALRAMGFDKEVEMMTVDNPARFLAHD